MKPILHIIKNLNETQAIDIIEKQARNSAYDVAVVFMRDAVSLPSMPGVRTCALIEESKDENISSEVTPGIELLSYDDLLNLIFSVESITVW